ncbi:MAG: NAD(P)H-dependent oxidoreductase subunit E [Pseudomonadota bacterium]|jgi:(2Fe-2S) ferredoxin|nr:NAD(P)H-dependent oxidoreductase subunit E [Pseudomonadota bacterium]
MSHYRHHVFFCCNQRAPGERTCCNDKGATRVRDYAKKRIKHAGAAGVGKVRINMAGCLERCEEGPVIVVYPDNVWYTYVDEDDVDEIIDEHLLAGRPVPRLMLKA